MTDTSTRQGERSSSPYRDARQRPGRGPDAHPSEGRVRAVIEAVRPEVDAGRFPIKRVIGEEVTVEADVFTDGHDQVSVVLRYRHESEDAWRELPMRPLPNDRWRASFDVLSQGRYRYTVLAWVDHFATWRRDLAKKAAAGQELDVDLRVGAALLRRHAEIADEQDAAADAARLRQFAQVLDGPRAGQQAEPAGGAQLEQDDDREQDDDFEGDGEVLQVESRLRLALEQRLAEEVAEYPDRSLTAVHPRELHVVVDRRRARFSSWYELFPRSWSPEAGRHGTLRDVIDRLDYVAGMGFDVLYLPPIHPIGRQARKGRNNAETAGPGDVGSPWAIGAAEGGHKAVHPDLGTLADVRELATRTRERGIDLALDLALQCAPDHPYVREHPEWFRRRPDGSIAYAENPPKRYQDIVPFDFECEDWRALWEELRSVVLFWIGHGVKVFRVDNPHTKPFPFWEWLITEVKREHPDVLFLSEAFTRPKVMARLAKLGFTQSYTYFTWRNTSWELTEYFSELTATDMREYFRPNAWPNTPDILPEALQVGGRPAFVARLVLASTLCASYGIYGPAFELQEARPREWGGEEYLDSEKYQLAAWDLEAPHSLRSLIARLNGIRREHQALQQDRTLRFHPTDNEQLLCYSKSTADLDEVILVVVNLDPHHTQSGWLEVPLDELGGEGQQAHDLLGGGRFLWQGTRHYVALDPHVLPAHVFRLRRRIRTEQDFDYFL